MQAALSKLYMGYGRAKAALCAFCLAFYIALVCWAGGSLGELLLVWGTAAVYILAPGWLAMRVSRMAEGRPALALPLTVLLGTGMLAVCLCFAARLHQPWLIRLVPLAPAAGAAALWLAEKRKKGEKPRLRLPALAPEHWLLALLAAALIFLLAFSNVIKYARPGRAGAILIEQDFLWMAGNAKSFLMGFPSIEIHFYDMRFAYHYLTELLCAALGMVTGVDCYNILAYYQQPLVLAALVGCLYAMGRVFYGEERKDKALLFTFSLFLFSCASLWAVVLNGQSLVGNSTITHLLTNITSQATATLYAAIFCCLFLTALRVRFRLPLLQLAVLLASFVLLIVAKGPMALIVGLSALIAVGWQTMQKKGTWQSMAAAAAGTLLFLLFYRLLFSASTNGSMSLMLTGTLERFILAPAARAVSSRGVLTVILAVCLWVVQLVLMVPAAIVPYGCGLAGDLRHLFRLAPERIFANAAAGGGLLAYFLFSHPNYSQVYFFLAAVVFLNLLAVDQMDLLLYPVAGARGRGLVRRLGLFGAAVGLLTAVLLYVHIGGSGILYFLRDTNVIARPVYETMALPDDEAAAVWLHDSTPAAGTMFATNRIDSDRWHADGISNIYTAFSGRQAFMEGYTYVADTAPWMWVKERREANARLFSADTDADTLREICRKYGITHLIYSSQEDGDESQLAAAFPCVFSSDSVRIYAVQ